MRKDIGIYIHIPFCMSKCYYCDFVSFTNCQEEIIEKYIDVVCLEILQNSEILSENNITSIYFGGGTPSYINPKYIAKILDTLKLYITETDFNNIEITIEINPATNIDENLSIYKEIGINRFSIGVQSTCDKVLKLCGRKHTFLDVKNTLKISKQIGIDNVSIDLIYPLPELTLNEFKQSINDIMNLTKEFDNIKHISIYNLEIHENTKLDFLLNESFVTLCNEDDEYEMKEYLENSLEKNGFIRYEISNFAKDNYYSRHNLNYWKQGEYLGFGVNAASFFVGKRYSNTASLNEYIELILSNKSASLGNTNNESLDKPDLMKEYMILNLRLISGVKNIDFKKRFGVEMLNIFKEEIEKLEKLNLIEVKTNVLDTKKR